MKVPWAFAAAAPALINALDHNTPYQEGKTPAVEKFGEDAVPTLDQPKPPGQKINPSDLSVTCSSSVAGHGCSNVLDPNIASYWQNENAGATQSITVDLKMERSISGLVMVPYQNADAFIETHKVQVSQDMKTWKEVAYGRWWPDNSEKLSVFQPEKGRYLRLQMTHSPGFISELDVYETEYIQPDPKKGAWGPTIDLPLVPVSGAVDPTTGNLIGWSSWQYNTYLQNMGSKTQVSTWNPYQRTVTPREVNQTNHDMFCPGITFDEDGNIVVTGGNSARQTTRYNTATGQWEKKRHMNVDRGYQGATILSDGRIFVIGGSFGEVIGNKFGEVYDVQADTWTELPECDVTKMYTEDLDSWRMDNHGWIFGWKNETVFQAGPSKQMNWYGVDGNGSTTPAGDRNHEEYGDAMCGNAVMFDGGKILGFGGSQDYEKSPALDDTYIISIDEPNTDASVVQPAGMKYKRTFHNSVVLPDGSVFVAGGQDWGFPFNETTFVSEPERFVYNAKEPAKSTWETWLPNTVARTYHSIALLLQDGTVFVGGGGLCGDCSANHFDGQIFTPPNHLNRDGSLRSRPVIYPVEQAEAKPGDWIKVKTDSRIAENAASIIRYGSATHTVDTDQRRLSVPFKRRWFWHGFNTYDFQIPEDPGVAAPGYYMLYVLDRYGTPSKSVNVRVAAV